MVYTMMVSRVDILKDCHAVSFPSPNEYLLKRAAHIGRLFAAINQNLVLTTSCRNSNWFKFKDWLCTARTTGHCDQIKKFTNQRPNQTVSYVCCLLD